MNNVTINIGTATVEELEAHKKMLLEYADKIAHICGFIDAELFLRKMGITSQQLSDLNQSDIENCARKIVEKERNVCK